MSKKIIAANWKMHLSASEAIRLLEGLSARLVLPPDTRAIICPPYPYLTMAKELLKTRPDCSLGAQNCHHQHQGAFTGAVSAPMLHSIGVSYVLIGHSERRQYCQENDALLYQKISIALQYQLKVIFCIGEPESVRNEGKEKEYITEQLAVLSPLSEPQLSQLMIAYEPIWAIGTGKSATPDIAQTMHAHIRLKLRQHFLDTGYSVPLLYGGSVTAQNARDLLRQKDIDGALVGGASLQLETFQAICSASKT